MRTRAAVVAVLGAALAASPLHAEVCGDADGNGTISVSDGVQVLRASAGLDAQCPATACDVDASGSVTVTDGVNVLRDAAGLEVSLKCATLSAQEQQAFGALTKSNQVTRLIALGLDATGSGAAAAAATLACPNGGTVAPSGGAVTYDGCRVRSTVCSGTATVGDGGFTPSLACRDLAEARDFDLTGGVTTSNTAAGPAITGNASGMQSGSSVFQFQYDGFTLDENDRGGRSAGEVDVGGSFFSGAFEQVKVSFPGRNPATGAEDSGFAKIVGLRSGGGGIIFVFVFDLNLATGKLTAR